MTIENLWEQFSEKRDDESREKLILACMPYIKASAYRMSPYTNSTQDVNDLVSAGIIGLIDAIKGFDPTKGSGFKNYAKYRIRGSIMDEIRAMNWVPYSVRDKARKIQQTMQEISRDEDTPPSEQEMAEAMGISLEKYRSMLMEVNRMTLSLLEDTFTDGDIPGDPDNASGDSPEEEIMLAERRALLGDAIDRLSEKERLVVTLYYYEEMTMKEIGEVMNVSESRICQIHSSAILRLHARLKYMDAGINR